MSRLHIFSWMIILSSLFACLHAESETTRKGNQVVSVSDTVLQKVLNAAINQTNKKVTYDGRYFVIAYPNGDIPDSLGVCTDVIIRAYRTVGFDLQKLIHEDMGRVFSIYNKRRHSDRIDANIDHRRVPNMETYFTRFGKKLAISDSAKDYHPGDIVFWDVAAGHVGIVVNVKSKADTNRFMVVHNIGSGPRMEDYLFGSKILGHYRYTPWKSRL
jgi:uncharacterized protein